MSVGSQHQLESLFFHLCVFVALEEFPWIFDLDGVLRSGSRSGDPLDVRIVPPGPRHLTLVTKNTSLGVDELRSRFDEIGIRFDQVITPVDMLNWRLGKEPRRIYLIGRADGLWENIFVVSRQDWEQAEALVILNKFSGMTPEEWEDVLTLAKTVPWYIAEDSYSTELRLCTEAAGADPAVGHRTIPDLGCFSRLLQDLGAPAPLSLGKPNVPQHYVTALQLGVPALFVGDSESDIQQAQRWEVRYLDVRSL